MSWLFSHQAATGGTYYGSVRKWDSGSSATWWDFTNNVWATKGVSAPDSDDFATLGEVPTGSGSYHVASSDTFASYTGLVLEEIWNAADGTGCQSQRVICMRAGTEQRVVIPASAVLTVDSDYTWTAVPNGTCNQVVLADASYDGFLAFDLQPGLNPHTALDKTVTPTVTDTGSILTPTDIAVSQDGLHVHFKIGATPVVAGTDYSIEVNATASDGKAVITTGTLRGT